MTQYLISVHNNPDADWAPDEIQGMFAAVDALNTELVAEGAWVFAGGLEPAETATTVDARSGEVLVTDGPFLETKEHVGGFWVVEAADLDAAMKIAERASAACREVVEVRPFQAE